VAPNAVRAQQAISHANHFSTKGYEDNPFGEFHFRVEVIGTR
jgi:hypothetical protein